jgi:hypothetical protein
MASDHHAAIPARSYAKVGSADVSWAEVSTANRRRAERTPRTPVELAASVETLATNLARSTGKLARALESCERPGLAEEQQRDRVEDLFADLILAMDLLAPHWMMDVARALAQRFNERGPELGSYERINPKTKRTPPPSRPNQEP